MSHNIKQVLVVRRDLNMRRGKECAQTGHGCLMFLSNKLRDSSKRWFSGWLAYLGVYIVWLDRDEQEWVEGRFTKVVLQCPDEETFRKIHAACRTANLPVEVVTDAGVTEFDGKPTDTVLAIGPADADDIGKITGKDGLYPLKLY